MPDLTNKTALVTGAGGGIGRAAVAEFVRCGVKKIAVVDINEATCAETADYVNSYGGSVIFCQADVADSDQVARYVQTTLEAFGRIDIFFNNAGYEGLVRSLDTYPEDDFERVINVNVRGVFLGMKHVIPVMKAQGSGAIINTASVTGLRGVPNMSVYSASKHAVIGLTRSAAAEVAQAGIRINAVCPSPIDNRMMESLERQANSTDPEAARMAFISRVPARRYGLSEEVARVVAFLASDDASWVIGAAIAVDGGRTAI